MFAQGSFELPIFNIIAMVFRFGVYLTGSR